jgi:hypothetical protein
MAFGLLAVFLLEHRSVRALWIRSQTIEPTPSGISVPPEIEDIDQTRPSPFPSRVVDHTRSQVVSTSGVPVAGATISVTPFVASADSSCFDDVALASMTSFAVTDADGTFSLNPVLADQSGSAILWCTHPEFMGRAFTVYGTGANDSIPATIELDNAINLTALVLGPDGDPLAGATVVEAADVSQESTPDTSELPPNARQAFVRVKTTDVHGLVALDPIPAHARAFARHGTHRSAWRSNSSHEPIVLNLRPTFLAAGRVLVPSDGTLASDTRICLGVRRNADLVVIDRFPVHSDTTWGPATIPLVPTTAYEFILEGDDLESERVALDPPDVGARVQVDFHPKAGLTLSVQVLTTLDQPLAGATASVLWNVDGAWVKIDRRTDASGLARFTSCPATELWIRGRCSGYAPKRLDSITLATAALEPVVVRLDHAGRISGHCLHGEIPVHTFTVLFWQGSSSKRDFIDVVGSTDGSFVIDEAPLGEVFLMAYAPDLPRSLPQQVLVQPGAASAVDLNLPTPIPGRGRIVDARTGEPLPHAVVQVDVMHENHVLKPWGGPIEVNQQGVFEINGFVEGYNGMVVSAPGFAQRSVVTHVVPATPVDFGTIGLFATQSIDVRVESDDLHAWSSTSVAVYGTHTIGPKQLASDGHVMFSGLEPGPYAIRVFLGDDTLLSDTVILRPGADLQVTEHVNGRHLLVEIVPEQGMSLPEFPALRVTYLTAAGGAADRCYRIPSDQRVDVSCIEGDHIVLAVEDWAGRIYGAEHVTLGASEPTVARVRVASPRHRLRVVDPSRQPIPHAHVVLSLPDDRSGWLPDLETDAEGLCDIPIAECSTAFVAVYDFSRGLNPSTLVNFQATGREPIDVVLNPDQRLQFVLRERATPAANIEIWSEDGQGVQYGLGSGSTDDKGLADWGPVAVGDYKLDVRQPGYWASSHRVHLDAAAGPIPIQVRRVGGVEFQIKTPLGNAAPGVAIAMRSDESGELLSDWIASGQVIAPSGGARSNADGRLRLNALPNGPFHWTVTSTDGESIEGEVTVPPLGLAHVDVTIP